MKSIKAKELREKLQNKEDFQIIDIREPYEYEDGALCNENIPLDKMMTSIDRISPNKPVVIYCQSGKRASAIIYMLEKEYNFNNLINLEGGYTTFMEEEYV
tara:strand:+ start:86 stop:388 length:303 start_codon:yes stop_codon:yes gene_type:complete